MEKMNKTDYQLFTTLAKLTQSELLRSMAGYLRKKYANDKITITKDFILCEGDIPVMLVAHMDTVFNLPPEAIYYDQEQRVMWSPEGLGADDRAGVFAIFKLIQKGYRPHICLTTDEEVGGLGAEMLITCMPQAPFDIKYVIQLDRQGTCDCVFYNCDNENFQEYVETFGFITTWGTFSDISIICPAWKIAGVNVSVGYIGEHTKQEILHTEALYSTITKVEHMLKEADLAQHYEYIPNVHSWMYKNAFKSLFTNNDTMPIKTCLCHKCHQEHLEDDVFPVKSKDGKDTYFYCIDCVSENVNWCNRCGEAFEMETPLDEYCADCAKVIGAKYEH